MSTQTSGFEEFVVARSPRLVRTAYLLTGDRDLAQDLVQTALARTWPHWHRVRDNQPEAYVRTVMVRLQASLWRRKWRGEVPTDVLPEPCSGAAPTDAVNDRVVLAKALALLPPGQRQIVVLRYVDDLSVDQVASIVGVAPGTVKSQSAKGLARLRVALGTPVPVKERT